MAIINYFDSLFEEVSFSEEIKVDDILTVKDIIEKYIEEKSKNETLVEVYNIETEETVYKSEENNEYKVLVIINGKEATLENIICESDNISIIFLPQGSDSNGITTALGVAEILVGVVIVGLSAPTGVGAMIGSGLIASGVGTLLSVAFNYLLPEKDRKNETGLTAESIYSISGSGNQEMTNKRFPIVLGKHLINPGVIGSAYNTTYTKNIHGSDGGQYVTALYCVGYAPLMLTDFKIGTTILAYNKSTENVMRDSVSHGTLKNLDADEEILNKWKNNDVSIEILQKGDFAKDDTDRYGTLYPQVCEQIDVNANLINIKDSLLAKAAEKSYKGVAIPDGYKTNSVRFSRSCPKRLEVELDFPNGLYASRVYSDDDKTKYYYYNLPVRLAVQWRYCKKGQESSNANSPDGWHDFDFIELKTPDSDLVEKVEPKFYTRSKKVFDYKSSLAANYFNINSEDDRKSFFDEDKWIAKRELLVPGSGYFPSIYAYSGAKLFEFGTENEPIELSNDAFFDKQIPDKNGVMHDVPPGAAAEFIGSITSYKISRSEFKEKYTVNQKRFVVVKEFSDEECRNIINYDGTGEISTNDYVEVRVLRINPCYMDEEGDSSGKWSNMAYQDLVKWTALRTFSFDGDKYKEALDKIAKPNTQTEVDIQNYKNALNAVNVNKYPLRPLSEADMDKFCIVALRMKQDIAETGGSNLNAFSLIAHSLAPKFSKQNNCWFPQVINDTYSYFRIKDKVKTSIQESEYNSIHANNPESVLKVRSGNDFVKQIKTEMFAAANLIDNTSSLTKYKISSLEEKYVSNNVASVALLTLVGRHLGNKAKTFDSVNLYSFTELYKFCENVIDGTPVSKADKTPRIIKYTCNGIVGNEVKTESLLQKILLTGRSGVRRDESNRYEVVIGRPVKYPVTVLNQKNCLSMSNTRGFEDTPSGYQVSFIDEDDNYSTNDVYVMSDGEDFKNPSKETSSISFEYVTNREQIWSLARFNLAIANTQRENYTRTVGTLGYSLSYGDMVLLQDSTLLIGSDRGGRIRQLLKNKNYIFGFITDDLFSYTGELDSNGLCIQGCTIVQPEQYKNSRCVTFRFAKPGYKIILEDTEYSMEKGLTNVCLFQNPVRLEDNGSEEFDSEAEYYAVHPKIDNLVAFGTVGEITQKALIMAIRPKEKHQFELSLVPYNEDLYLAGGVMPEFKSHITNESEFDGAFLSPYKKIDESIAESVDVSNIIAEKLSEALALGSATGQAPDDIISLSATPKENYIILTAKTNESGLKNSISKVTWVINKGSEDKTSTITTEGLVYNYYFDRSIDGYPEASDLEDWTVTCVVTNVYGLDSKEKSEKISTSGYGTWIPPEMPVTSWDCIASENGIIAENNFSLDNKKVYYGLPYTSIFEYLKEGSEDWRVFENSDGREFVFDRNIDGFPEKEDLQEKSIVRVHLKSSIGKEGNYTQKYLNLDSYGTWIPTLRTTEENSGVAPTRVNISHRSATFTGSQPTGRKVYGDIRYGLQINKVETDGEEYFTPATDLDPYESEENYKNSESKEPLWTSRNFNQILPLTGQNGYMWQLDQKKERVVTNSNGTDSSIEYANKTTYIPVKDLLTSKDFYDTSVISEFIPNHFDTENATIGQSVEWTRDKVQEASYVKDDGFKFDSTKEYSKKMDAFVLKVGSDTILAIEKNIGMVMFERDRS